MACRAGLQHAAAALAPIRCLPPPKRPPPPSLPPALLLLLCSLRNKLYDALSAYIKEDAKASLLEKLEAAEVRRVWVCSTCLPSPSLPPI